MTYQQSSERDLSIVREDIAGSVSITINAGSVSQSVLVPQTHLSLFELFKKNPYSVIRRGVVTCPPPVRRRTGAGPVYHPSLLRIARLSLHQCRIFVPTSSVVVSRVIVIIK